MITASTALAAPMETAVAAIPTAVEDSAQAVMGPFEGPDACLPDIIPIMGGSCTPHVGSVFDELAGINAELAAMDGELAVIGTADWIANLQNLINELMAQICTGGTTPAGSLCQIPGDLADINNSIQGSSSSMTQAITGTMSTMTDALTMSAQLLNTTAMSMSTSLEASLLTNTIQLIEPTTVMTDFLPVQTDIISKMPHLANTLNQLQSSSSTSCPVWAIGAWIPGSQDITFDMCSPPWSDWVRTWRAFMTISLVVAAASWQIYWWRGLFVASQVG